MVTHFVLGHHAGLRYFKREIFREYKKLDKEHRRGKFLRMVILLNDLCTVLKKDIFISHI